MKYYEVQGRFFSEARHVHQHLVVKITVAEALQQNTSIILTYNSFCHLVCNNKLFINASLK